MVDWKVVVLVVVMVALSCKTTTTKKYLFICGLMREFTKIGEHIKEQQMKELMYSKFGLTRCKLGSIERML